MKATWYIENTNGFFDRLKDLMWHIEIAYTPKERIKYLNNQYIVKITKKEAVAKYVIEVFDDGHFRKHKI